EIELVLAVRDIHVMGEEEIGPEQHVRVEARRQVEFRHCHARMLDLLIAADLERVYRSAPERDRLATHAGHCPEANDARAVARDAHALRGPPGKDGPCRTGIEENPNGMAVQARFADEVWLHLRGPMQIDDPYGLRRGPVRQLASAAMLGMHEVQRPICQVDLEVP